jgi:predicted dehydrogenase
MGARRVHRLTPGKEEVVGDRVRWGVLSTALIGTAKVIPGIGRSRRGEVVAIASRDEATARRVATELGIERAHGSYEALLADPDVDALYIPLPNHLHADWAIRALEAGKHVLCEKPVAVTAADAERMAEAAGRTGRVLMEAFMYRHHPSWVRARELIAEGRIGRLVAVDSWFSYYLDDPTNIRNVAAYGGGALYDIGCYCVNLSRMLFGSEPVDVAASLVRDPATGVDILTSGHLAFADGIASFTCATQAEPDQRVHVYGTQGRITIPIPFNIPPTLPTEITLTTGRQAPEAYETETFAFEPADPYACEADAFAAAILDGAPAPVPMSDAIANLRVIERLFAAAEG